MTCVRCAGSGDTLETSHGTMCRPCFQEGMKRPPDRGPRLFTLPAPGQRVWVVLDERPSEEKGLSYITVNSTLYAFERQQDAESFRESLLEQCGIAGRLELLDAREPLGYVMRYGSLRLVTVKEICQGTPKPTQGSIAAPF